MRFKVANYSRLEIRLDTLHIYNYLSAKFGDFSFSRFGFIARTDRQTESQRRLNAVYSRDYRRRKLG